MANENNGINYGVVALIAVVAAVISSFVTYKAVADNSGKFAVVDVQRVVVSSRDIAALKIERDAQVAELKKMADNANVKIKAEKDEDAKKKLSEKYLTEINGKKDEFDEVYASALQASDKKLNDIINAVAEKEGLKVVFNKASLVTGGTDITEAVVEQVK
ncbi:MAG: OmpH family outer membrane protein [Alphaproteobacteria bacterium]|nr:OmpH family outer membrane protein [Alphaproteobacteria bacterium]